MIDPASPNTKNLPLAPFTTIVNDWFGLIVKDDGSPDHICINLVSILFSFYNSKPFDRDYYPGPEMPFMEKGRLVANYEYLTKRIGNSQETLRRCFVRLEKMGVLQREVVNVLLSSGQRINKLYISFSSKLLDSSFRDPDTDARVIAKKPKASDDSKDHSNIDNCSDENLSKSDDLSIVEDRGNFCGDHIKESRNNYKNRSMGSNFIFGDSGKENLVLEQKSSKHPQDRQKKISSLKDFYPLSDQDTEELKILSGREFTKRAMNEILLSMANKLTGREFFSKKGFMSYMSKVFSYEKRQASVINNKNFRIKANYSSEELEAKEREKFLSDLEYNRETSPEMHFKKKLAAVLSPKTAYNLLIQHISTKIVEGELILIFNKQVAINQSDQRIILNQANAVYSKLGEGEVQQIKTLRITIKEKVVFAKPSRNENTNLSLQERKTSSVNVEIPEGIWGEVRKKLISELGEQGRAIDKSWFSKLSDEIDEKRKTLSLKAPSEFFKDYISSNYLHQIKRYAQSQGYVVGDVLLC